MRLSRTKNGPNRPSKPSKTEGYGSGSAKERLNRVMGYAVCGHDDGNGMCRMAIGHVGRHVSG